jgi:hypothetical protein
VEERSWGRKLVWSRDEIAIAVESAIVVVCVALNN